MPWCEECAKFWNPPSMGAGGECPSCGHVLPATAVDERPGAEVPWHFKLLVAAVVLYLLWRVVEMIGWLV